MNAPRSIIVFAVLMLSLFARQGTEAQSGEVVYYRAVLPELNFDSGEGPRPFNRQRFHSVLVPHVVMENGEMVFLAWMGQNHFRMRGGFDRLTIATVGDKDGPPPKGILYMPETTTGVAFSSYPFQFRERSLTDRTGYREVKLVHYERLNRSPGAGGVWFRHRAETIRARMEAEGEDLPPSAVRRVPRSGQRQLDETFRFFAGGRAVAENLALEDELMVREEEGGEMIPWADIRGITIPEMDWQDLLAEETPVMESLAGRVPSDQPYVYLPDAEAIRRADKVWREGASGLLGFLPIPEGGEDLLGRYEKQLLLEGWRGTWGEEGAPEVEMVLTGSDWFFSLGTDVALLVRGPGVSRLVVELEQRSGEVRAGLTVEERQRSEEWAEKWSGQALFADGLLVVVDESRERSAFWGMLDEETLLLTNSAVQVDRFAAVGKGETRSLGDLEEFQFFRQEMPVGPEETAFVFLSDDTIRRWCGPEWRIISSRRIRALAELDRELAWRLDGFPPRDDLPLAGSLTTSQGRLQSERYGHRQFLTPVVELQEQIAAVTASERRAYERWRMNYERQWGAVFDPIGLQVLVEEQGMRLRLAVIPVTVRSQYRELMDLTAGGAIQADSGGYHPRDLARVIVALDRESQFFREMREGLSRFAPQTAEPLMRWIGDSASLFFPEDPIWSKVEEAEDLNDFLGENWINFPVGIRVESRDGLSLGLFLGALRSFAEGAAPGLLAWETRYAGEEEHPYVVVRERGGRNQWLSGGTVSISYATTPEALIVSLNEGVIRQILEEEKTGQTREGETPWLGQHLNLNLGPMGTHLAKVKLDREQRQQMGFARWHDQAILQEMRALFPDQDPVEFYRSAFGEHLRCPLGGEWQWDEASGLFYAKESGDPLQILPEEVVLNFPLAGLGRMRMGLTFAHDGVMVETEALWRQEED